MTLNPGCLRCVFYAFVFNLSVGGGELFDRIIDENYTLMELDAVVFIRQICEGLQHMHKMYILHLDLKVTKLIIFVVIYIYKNIFQSLTNQLLKLYCFVCDEFQPENILCVSRVTNKIKIIDFGLARV